MVLSLGLGWLRLLWRVDPDSGLDFWWFWALAGEPFRRAWERSIKGDLAGGMDGVGLPEVDLIGCHQPDACVMMVLIIPGEETAAESACILDGLIPLGEFRLIFQGLEMGLPRTGCRLTYVDGCAI